MFAMQEEIGESGTPHVQGYIGWWDKIRARNYFPKKVPWLPKLHWTKLVKGTHWEHAKYCQKEDSRMANGWSITRKILVPVDPRSRRSENLRDWQKELLHKLLTNTNKRTVFWIVDEVGNQGKSWFAAYLQDEHHCLAVAGTGKDMMYSANIWSQENKFCTPDFVIFDIPRSAFKTDGSLAISWGGLEMLLNGRGFSSKYESGAWKFGGQPRAVVVFANQYPDKDKMSNDRWQIMTIVKLTKSHTNRD